MPNLPKKRNITVMLYIFFLSQLKFNVALYPLKRAIKPFNFYITLNLQNQAIFATMHFKKTFFITGYLDSSM